MNLKHMIASAVVRRLVYVVIAGLIALGASLFSGNAKAQSQPTITCGNLSVGCDEGKAFSECVALIMWYASPPNTVRQNPECFKETDNSVGVVFKGRFTGGFYGATYASPTKRCSSRPAYYVGVVGGATAGAPQCDFGCEMKTTGGHQKRTDTRSSAIFTGTGVATATGATCANGAATPPRAPPKEEFCSGLDGGSHQICQTKDGKTCVKSNRTGRRYCGDNDFPTVGVDPGRTEATAISANTNPPIAAPIPQPRPGETFMPDSSATVTNTTTNNTTNVTNYNNSGTPGTGVPSVPGDGSGNEGEPGDGGGDDEGEDWGSPGAGVGELYAGSDDTMESIVAAWWTQMQSTPALAQINTFFGNCGYSGACPALVYSNDWMGDLNFSQLCDGTMGDILGFAGYIVLAMGAFAAFRIAIY